MKNEKPEETNLTGSIFDEPAENVEKAKIKCKKGNISGFACMTRNCPSRPFVCQDDDCECQIDHENCQITKTSSVIKALNKKIVSIKPLEDAINTTIDRLIDELSNYRDKTLLEWKERFEFLGLRDSEINLLKSLREEKDEDITSNNFSEVNMNAKRIEQILFDINGSVSRIKKATIESITEWIECEADNLGCFLDDYDEFKENIIINKNIAYRAERYLQQNFFEKSSIISDLDEIAFIFNALDSYTPVRSSIQDQKYFSKISLLFKASENQFSTDAFYRKCSNIPNTLILCKSTTGYVFGGFSTEPWGIKKENLQTYGGERLKGSFHVSDSTNNSFIFSLTQKDKFGLKKERYSSYSITWWAQELKRGPTFGISNSNLVHDLVICDKANQNNNSYVNLNQSYFNENYDLLSGKVDYQRFIGKNEPSNHFTLKEWEVFQLLP